MCVRVCVRACVRACVWTLVCFVVQASLWAYNKINELHVEASKTLKHLEGLPNKLSTKDRRVLPVYVYVRVRVRVHKGEGRGSL